MKELHGLNGKNAWKLLTEKLKLYKADGKTIFDEAVPNKAGALIKSWMERDLEMSAMVKLNGATMKMVVTRWGFVQIYNDNDDMEPVAEFYVYDYCIDQEFPNENKKEMSTRLSVRQHQTWAPLAGLTMHYDIAFHDLNGKTKFEHLVGEFQATHAPQT